MSTDGWEGVRSRNATLASLAASGQQTPIVVVAVAERSDRYLVIDGYKRIVALEQLGRDTGEVVVWPMSEAAAPPEADGAPLFRMRGTYWSEEAIALVKS